MRVLFIPSWYHNKRNPVYGSFFKEQALAIKEAGIEIVVAYNEIWPLPLLFSIKEKAGLSYNLEYELKTYRYKNFNFLPKNPLMFKVFNKRMEKLYKEIVEKEGKIDLIHCHSSFWAGISANYISKKYNIPLIITEHSSLKRAIYIKDTYKPLIKKSYLEADKLIAVGNGLKEEIYEFTNREDIEVIHNLIDIDSFNIRDNKNIKFTFFSLAFLEEGKGMDTLLKAFSKYFKDSDSTLLIGGNGSQKEELMNLSKNLNIEDKVKFLGALSREEVAEYMSLCDCFVLASRYETFGVVYIEALASGKPIIGTFNGGAEDIIDKENGLIVKVDDIDALGKAMCYIKDNINLYDKEKIRLSCINKFSNKKITDQILEIYDLVLKKRG